MPYKPKDATPARYYLIFAGIVMLLVSAAWIDPPDPRAWDGPALGGEWVCDTGETCWYLHSNAEFDAPIETCNECHGGDAFYNQMWICPVL